MTTEKKTLGQAIDEIIAALSALDEKARPTAIAAACAHLGLDASATQQPTPLAADTSARGPSIFPESKPTSPIDIRLFKDKKMPENATEMACLVAYYLQEQAPAPERKDTVSIDDIQKYFKQAHFPLPKRIQQLLVAAKHAGYFDAAERGKYRLNAVGYNLAAHTLPRGPKAGA